MIDKLKDNPCCNRLLKIKLKIKDIKKLDFGSSDSNNNYKNELNFALPLSCLNRNDLVSGQQEETSNRITKISNPFTSNSTRRLDQKLPHKDFVLNELKKPERYFSVNHNQYNIATRISHNKHYQPISSFELTLSKELQRLSHSYKNEDNRKMFYENESLTSLFHLKPNYELYRDVKLIKNRFSSKNYKAKLLPLGYKTKDNMNKLAKKFYNHSCYLMHNKPHLSQLVNND